MRQRPPAMCAREACGWGCLLACTRYPGLRTRPFLGFPVAGWSLSRKKGDSWVLHGQAGGLLVASARVTGGQVAPVFQSQTYLQGPGSQPCQLEDETGGPPGLRDLPQTLSPWTQS